MPGIDPSAEQQTPSPSSLSFGRVQQAWVLGLYPLLWLLTFVGVRSAEPQILGIPLWYLGAGLVVLLLVPLNLYVVHACWPRTQDD